VNLSVGDSLKHVRALVLMHADAFKVGQFIVEGVPVNVVNLKAFRNRSVMKFPDGSV